EPPSSKEISQNGSKRTAPAGFAAASTARPPSSSTAKGTMTTRITIRCGRPSENSWLERPYEYEQHSKNKKQQSQDQFSLSTGPCAAQDGAESRRNPSLRNHRQIAQRFERESLPGECRAAEPDPRRHHDHPGHVQEAPLAGRRKDFLSTALAFRQALRRTSGVGGSNCRTNPGARRLELRDGGGRGRKHGHPAPAQRPRGSAGADLAPAYGP